MQAQWHRGKVESSTHCWSRKRVLWLARSKMKMTLRNFTVRCQENVYFVLVAESPALPIDSRVAVLHSLVLGSNMIALLAALRHSKAHCCGGRPDRCRRGGDQPCRGARCCRRRWCADPRGGRGSRLSTTAARGKHDQRRRETHALHHERSPSTWYARPEVHHVGDEITNVLRIAGVRRDPQSYRHLVDAIVSHVRHRARSVVRNRR